MDTVKTGRILARLRKDQGLTQQQLAEELGVTGKTVSRWETGAYLPPIDILQSIAGRYGITVDQLLNGQAPAAKKPVVQTRESSFTAPEQLLYYRRKWERDHRSSLIAGILLLTAIFVIGLLRSHVLSIVSVLLVFVFSVIRHNKKMAYAEWKTYVEPRLGAEQQKQ